VDPKNREAALKLSSTLTASGRSSDALSVLEDAVKQSPGSPSLELALGQAYVKSGEAEKGISHMTQGMKDDIDPRGPDPGMLNDAAYLLATAKTHLEEAKGFAEKAVAVLDARSIDASGSDEDGLLICTEFPAAWDTLGWVYFQMGDFNRAESYLRAAWVLGQNAISGDHLAQALEKLGKKKEAENLYVLALSASSVRTTTWGVPVMDPPSAYQERRKQILSHYEHLTGRAYPPPVSINRLPNGEWTKTPSDQLRDARSVKLGNTSSVNGSAEFSVVIAPGKVESVRYRYGDDQMKPMMEQLSTAHYPMLFPAGSGARIVRRVLLMCSTSSGCSVEVLPPGLMTNILSRN